MKKKDKKKEQEEEVVEVYTDEKGIVHGGPYDGMTYQDAYNQYSNEKLKKARKKQAKKGRKIVHDGQAEFVQSYVSPALRAAAALYAPTSIGVTAVDAYSKAKQGDYLGASADVATEVLSGLFPSPSKGMMVKKTPKWFRKTTKIAVRPTFSMKRTSLGDVFSAGSTLFSTNSSNK